MESAPTRSDLPEHEQRPDESDTDTAPEWCTEQRHPGDHDEGGAEQADEQPVPACGVDAEDAAPWRAAGHEVFPDTHAGYRHRDKDEECGGRPGPGHP